jgi:hypothetical protein
MLKRGEVHEVRSPASAPWSSQESAKRRDRLARLAGDRGRYPEYLTRPPKEIVAVAD